MAEIGGLIQRRLEHRPSPQTVWLIVLLTASLSAGFLFYFGVLDRQLAPYDIVSFELAWTRERGLAMLEAWGPAGRAAARQSLLVDFGFMPAYALCLAGLTLLAARAAHGRARTLGFWLIPAPLLAWDLDVIENVALLYFLENGAQAAESALRVAGAAAVIKFALLAAAVVYGAGALAIGLSRRGR